MTRFDYSSLPFGRIAAAYRRGASWRELAEQYGAPDPKRLKENTLERFPDLEPRDRAEAQWARRDREAVGRGRQQAQRAWWER